MSIHIGALYVAHILCLSLKIQTRIRVLEASNYCGNLDPQYNALLRSTVVGSNCQTR